MEALINFWKNDPTVGENIVVWEKEPARNADRVPFPPDMDGRLVSAIKQLGIDGLYLHQLRAWEAVQAKKHLVIATGTASGKTLCYNLPVLDSVIKSGLSTALYLFPTRALAADQKNQLDLLIKNIDHTVIPSAVYDGDTSQSNRKEIRQKTRLLLSNPDMLHIGILPHHTRWNDFLRNLRFVIIDEVHTYRGVFGSHVANVIRRLKRVAGFYGSSPLFIMTSATIANPAEHASRLVDEAVTVIDQDGSPRGTRNFLIYNPPLVDKKLGLRRNAGAEAVRLASDLLHYRIQTIIFGQSRRTVEILLMSLRTQQAGSGRILAGYRSGYLPQERRQVEQGLRSGDTDLVVATNALELGVDIGSMDAVVLVGYPGTIASTRQQAGRAGRRSGSSLAILIASANPLDQYLVKHPNYLFGNSPEKALINADNLLILLNHLKCACFELPLMAGDRYGSVDPSLLEDILQILVEEGLLHFSGGRYSWLADQYPAAQVSLRSISAAPFLIQTYQEGKSVTIGEVDAESAAWMTHPEAVYLHAGEMYRVLKLDFDKGIVELEAVNVDYFTEAVKKVTIQKIDILRQESVPGGMIFYGEILVTSQVVGYRMIDWQNHQVLGERPLEMPPSQLQTMAYWLALDSTTVDRLREMDAWRNDTLQYGVNWKSQRELALQRDRYTCQVCGAAERDIPHHVHHIKPFRTFSSPIEANDIGNLITLCPACHHKVELAVRMKSGLSGLGYVIHNLSSLFLMCDSSDMEYNVDPQSSLADGKPTVVLFERIAGGIGLAESLFDKHQTLIEESIHLVQECHCIDGCPSCVGPAGENGIGGKQETLALLSFLIGERIADE